MGRNDDLRLLHRRLRCAGEALRDDVFQRARLGGVEGASDVGGAESGGFSRSLFHRSNIGRDRHERERLLPFRYWASTPAFRALLEAHRIIQNCDQQTATLERRLTTVRNAAGGCNEEG